MIKTLLIQSFQSFNSSYVGFSLDSLCRAQRDGPATFHDHATEGAFAAVQAALSSGANVDALDADGRTALHLAADRNHIEIVKLLLQHKANPNAVDTEGQTALHNSVVCENVEIVKALLSAGAKADIKDNAGETAFDMCSSEEIQSLLESSQSH